MFVIWLVLLSVPSLGFTCVLPRILAGPALFLNMAWAASLALNILFNFAAAILRHPGPRQSPCVAILTQAAGWDCAAACCIT